MRPIQQLLRQPMKTISGMILITLAVAVLCLCLGQAMIVADFEASLDTVFTTIALPTEIYQVSSGTGSLEAYLPEDISRWMKEMAANNQEIVKAVASPGLASAYIRELNQDNYTQHKAFAKEPYNTLTQNGTPYHGAMFVVTITENNGLLPTTVPAMRMTGVIDSVVCLENGYADPTGFEIEMFILMNDKADADWIDLEVGQTYLIYGTEYYDKDWEFRCALAETRSMDVDMVAPFDPDLLTYYSDEAIGKNIKRSPIEYAVAQYTDYENDFAAVFTNRDMEKFRSCSLHIKNTCDIPEFQNQEDTPKAAYVKLEGTAGEFLASEAGAAWQQLLKNLRISNQAFPVIGVNNLMHIADFARGTAEVTMGRSFTQADTESGNKVCIISQTVATAAGLTVGDTITLQYYEHDGNSTYTSSFAKKVANSTGINVINPGAEFYTSMTPFANDGEEYTIIGLYAQKNEWCDLAENPYSFTPNTVFVPQASVTVEMQYTNQGLFGALELYNGRLDDFYSIIDEAGHSALFVCYDQGYSIVVDNLQNYGELARQAAAVGVVIYAIILLLYLVTFPAQQGKTLRLMGAMGASWREKSTHIVTMGLGILLPGTAIGAALAVLLWDIVVETLTSVVVVELDLSINLGIILFVALGQLLLAVAMTLLVSLPMTSSKSVNRR